MRYNPLQSITTHYYSLLLITIHYIHYHPLLSSLLHHISNINQGQSESP